MSQYYQILILILQILKFHNVGSGEVSSDRTDFGDELDDNGPNTVDDATVTASANFPNWTTIFTDITIEPFMLPNESMHKLHALYGGISDI